MKTRTLFILLVCMLFLGFTPLLAQNSPAGGLASGNVVNRDVDTYMMVNFAPFVIYDKVFTFAQTSLLPAAGGLPGAPGFQMGLGARARGNVLHFYLNTTGYSMDNIEEVDTGTVPRNDSTKTGKLNLQFDSMIGSTDIGAFKLGLNFFDVGQKETQ
jgi:hypothetical protein